MNKPVAYWDGKHFASKDKSSLADIPLYTHPVKEQKCIVKDCENNKHEGGFVGDLCKPCHQFITTGEGIYSQMYRNTHPVKEQELLEEITKLRWKINHLEIDIDSLRTTLFDIRQKYDTKNKHYVYTQVYVDELQAKIEALKAHPVKELTDEEILEVWRENERVYPMDRSRLLDRTRACIKKASEK